MNYDKLTPLVNRFLRTWVHDLGLSGWHITWTWSPRTAVNHRASYDAVAATLMDTSKQQAHILVDQEREWQTANIKRDYSLQATLLHELLHIRLVAGEALLGNLGTVMQPHLTEAVADTAHELVTAVREFYVEAATSLLLDQEAKCKLKHK